MTGGELPALDSVRSALEQALGIKFEGEKGAHFFPFERSCRRFSTASSPSWVLWAQEAPPVRPDSSPAQLARGCMVTRTFP